MQNERRQALEERERQEDHVGRPVAPGVAQAVGDLAPLPPCPLAPLPSGASDKRSIASGGRVT